jgi:hypothetical protein
MKTSWMWMALVGTAMTLAAGPGVASELVTADRILEQDETTPQPGANVRHIVRSDWSGPRVGFMVAPGDAGIAKRMKASGLGTVVSQFGWQFERRVSAFDRGPQLVTEMVPLFGGVEYNKLVPSLNGLVGLRFANGLEMGMGPSFSIVSTTTSPSAGLLIAVGKSLDYGEVCIPVNLAISTNPKGTMINLLVGYAIDRRAQ